MKMRTKVAVTAAVRSPGRPPRKRTLQQKTRAVMSRNGRKSLKWLQPLLRADEQFNAASQNCSWRAASNSSRLQWLR
ncbi:hypothetical protein V5799_019845 [Amblyomma americanum]|uniref:Uncharacterized protein n=1 Tax=Amblyomma americanum TaxID=6943 RepID=A0AAQ4EW49_AMBAM